jgi:hypothetical protein
MIVQLKKNRLVVLLAATLSANAAMAANPVGNASAWDLSVDINLVGVTQLNVGAQTSVQLTNVLASASDSQTMPSAAFASPLNLITLSTGALASNVEYVGSNMSAIAARSSVDDLDLAAAGVLSLVAGTVTSTSSLAGACPDPVPGMKSMLDDFVFYSAFDNGNLGPGGGGGGGGFGGLPPSGGALIDPSITILGTVVPGLPLNPGPNTIVDLGALGIVGATLVLNEQTTTGDGVHSLATATNAIHLTLNVAQLVTADVIIAHSEVSLACP